MTLTQWLVVTWVGSILAATLLLLVASAALRQITQPADRIRLIHFTLMAALATPLLFAMSPLSVWRLNVIATTASTMRSLDSERDGGLTDDVPPHQPDAPAVLPVDETRLTSVETAPSPAAQPAASISRPVALLTPAWFEPWAIALVGLIGGHVFAAVFFLVEATIGLMRWRRLMEASVAADETIRRMWDSVAGGQGHRTRLRISSAIDTPLAFGWFRPTVLVPTSVVAGPPQALRFCLAHEWSHIERGDIPSWWFTWCCQFGLWCQPMFWRLRRELRICQDLLADDRAAASDEQAIEYAELLVHFARQRQTRSVTGALGFLDQPRQLTRRVTMLLESRDPFRSRCTSRFTFMTAVAVASFAALLCGVRLDAVQAKDVELVAAPAEKKAEKAPETKPASATNDKKESLNYSAVVLDKSTGKGLAGAMVTVRRSVLTSQENRIIEESKHVTDENGKYSFIIPPEQVAERYLYIELDVKHTDYASRTGFGYALSMIRKNETLGERPFFEKVELDPADPVTGTVLSPEGRPLEGVKVQGYSKQSATDFRDYGSFTDTVTDANGKFRLNLVKGGVGVFWVLPTEYASTSRAVSIDHGDVGEIRLKPGVRVHGRVLSADGQLAAGVPVNIDYSDGGNETVNDLPVTSSIRRSAVSDADGKFAFDPLPSGNYRLIPEERRHDPIIRDRTRYKLPGVFLATKLTLKDGEAAPPVEVQAVPHVVFHAQYYDGQGKTTRGHEMFLFGELDGQHWWGQGRPDTEGKIAMPLPHGLQKVRVQLMTNEHGALRFRRGPGKELENRNDEIDFGTLNDDVHGFEIIRYKAPLVLVSVVDESQHPIKGFRVSAAYSWGKQRYVLEDEISSDLTFEKQDDGRYRTSQMLPDEDVTFTVTAPGYDTVTEKVRLPEGEQKDLVVTLKKKATEAKQE